MKDRETRVVTISSAAQPNTYLGGKKINQLLSDQCFPDSISCVAYTTSEEIVPVFFTCVIHFFGLNLQLSAQI